MRWFIEISSLGASGGPKQKWCIEAAGWQPALKEARSLRGEEGPLGGFSIELLDDGARAVDPSSRIRYVIREAPADAPLTHTKAGPVSTAAAPPSSTSVRASAAPAAAAVAPVAPAPADPVAPEADAPVATPLAAAPSTSASSTAASPTAAQVPSPVDDEVDIPVDEEEAPPALDAALPTYKLLTSREEEPSERSPLTYREHVYVVDPSTTDANIERLIRARFEAIKAALGEVKPGRFVNLAVFDHRFEGKPQQRPRATLSWKDWRGAVELRFPAAERASLSPASFAAPTSASQEVPAPSILPAARAPSVPPTEQAAAASPAAVVVPAAAAPAAAAVVAPAAVVVAFTPATESPASAMAATEPAPTQVASAEPSPDTTAAAAPAQDPPAVTTVTPKTDVSRQAEPAPSALEPSPASKAPTPTAASSEEAETVVAPKMDAPTVVAPSTEAPITLAVVQASGSISPKIEAKSDAAEASVARPSVPVSSAPKTLPAVAPTAREAFIPKVKTAKEAGRRASGDDLISELFEACGDLQFLRDALEGADFVLHLALEKLPSEVGMVSLFDINRREFVVIRQAGGPRSVVLQRLPERAGLAQQAMRKRAAVVVADASKEPRALDDRYRTLGIVQKSLMVAPVEQSGRYLGLIELCNPTDGRPFTEGDGHALTYIGEQFGEFVAAHGVLLDPDQVIERHQKR